MLKLYVGGKYEKGNNNYNTFSSDIMFIILLYFKK